MSKFVKLPQELAHRIIAPRVAYVVVTRTGGSKFNLAPFSNFTSVATSPQRIVLSVYKNWQTLKNIKKFRTFTVNVMKHSAESVQQLWILGSNYSSVEVPRDISKAQAAGVQLSNQEFEVPFLDGALAYLNCRAHKRVDVGDHVMIVADVLEGFCTASLWSTEAGQPNFAEWNPVMQASGPWFMGAADMIKADTKAANAMAARRSKGET